MYLKEIKLYCTIYLLNLNLSYMRLICPECKNEVDLSRYPNLAVGNVIECQMCGISLLVNAIGEEVAAEIVDEGK